jgi:hypothetical protein
MITAAKSTLSLNNLKILRPKVTKNLTNLHKKFCESPPRFLKRKTRIMHDRLFLVQLKEKPNSVPTVPFWDKSKICEW